MTDLLTSLQQQIEKLSTALCQIPGSLYLKATSEEEIKSGADLVEGIPDIQPIFNKLALLIDAVPSLKSADELPKQKEKIVELWSKRISLDAQIDQATELLQKLHERLTTLHEALVIHSPNISKKRKSDTKDVETGINLAEAVGESSSSSSAMAPPPILALEKLTSMTMTTTSPFHESVKLTKKRKIEENRGDEFEKTKEEEEIDEVV